MKRMRGRGHRPGGGGGGGGGGGPIRHHSPGNIPLNRNHVFDSSGPDIRVRGTAQQLFEKYLQLGRDATSGGDRVLAEGYFQHAEHYFRILSAAQLQQQQYQNQNQNPNQGPQNYQQNGGPRPQANGNVNGNVNGNGDGSMQPVIGSAPVFSLAEAADEGDDEGDDGDRLE